MVKDHVRCMTEVGEWWWWQFGRVLNMLHELNDGDPVKAWILTLVLYTRGAVLTKGRRGSKA